MVGGGRKKKYKIQIDHLALILLFFINDPLVGGVWWSGLRFTVGASVYVVRGAIAKSRVVIS